MKSRPMPLFLTALLLAFPGGCRNSEEPPISYLDQPPPGMNPVPFAPGIFEDPDVRIHGFPAISPDGDEVAWPVIPPRIMTVRKVGSEWTAPAAASFSSGNIQAPVFSVAGNRIYFQKSDPGGYGSLDIWYVEKTANAWGKKVNLGRPPNSDRLESQPSLTRDGTIYFTGHLGGALMNRGIFRSRYREDRYEEPVPLPPLINSHWVDYTPFIAPDESFLLFSSSRPSPDEKDIRIHVSFRDENDLWTEPLNLSRVMGFDRPCRFPCLTPDGKYIIFLSGDGFYWVSAEILAKGRG